jgi:hypothetical protein
MQYDVYNDLHIKEGYSVFEFFSVGRRGVILKRIAFAPTEYEDVYNLVFGDINVDGEIDDFSNSGNGDRNKVLSTIAHVIEIYLRAFPNRFIFFTGSTQERTRLYRMAIGINLDKLLLKFEIYSKVGNDILPFRKNMELEGFLVKIKS